MSGIASLRSQNTRFSSSRWKYKLGPQFRKVNKTFSYLFCCHQLKMDVETPKWISCSQNTHTYIQCKLVQQNTNEHLSTGLISRVRNYKITEVERTVKMNQLEGQSIYSSLSSQLTWSGTDRADMKRPSKHRIPYFHPRRTHASESHFPSFSPHLPHLPI